MTTSTDLSALTIGLMGCGKMGSAMLRGWLDAGLTRVDVLDPAPLPPAFAAARHHTDSRNFTGPWDMLVIAVKPQIMAEACAALAETLPGTTPVLSIAAGQTISRFKTYFCGRQPVIRAMPNTPAAIGKGITVACASPEVTEAGKNTARSLLAATGAVVWTDDEALMDAVTAVSGSGPAYVFYLIEALSEAGRKAGLPDDLALALARQTVIGSAALAEADAATPAATLRRNVTSPGGTTEAALNILMDGRLQKLFDDAIEAARDRSRALSK